MRFALAHWIDELVNGDASPVPRTVIDTRLSYVSRWFHLDQKDAPNWHCLSAARTKEAPSRAAIMLRAEEDRWGVALLAVEGPCFPLTMQDFWTLPPASATENCITCSAGRRQFRLFITMGVAQIGWYTTTGHRWPEGLVAIGDLVCALDPYFGLGMTAAARGALLLATHLDQNGGEMASTHAFQKELASLNVAPWQIATLCDADGRPLASDRTALRQLYEVGASEPRDHTRASGDATHAATDGRSNEG